MLDDIDKQIDEIVEKLAKSNNNEDAVEATTDHPDKLGAGSAKRKKLKGPDKVHAVMKEFKTGTLHSGSGEKVTDRKQAIAIGMSEAGMSKAEIDYALARYDMLEKSHKYIKREGVPGKYVYTYADGSTSKSPGNVGSEPRSLKHPENKSKDSSKESEAFLNDMKNKLELAEKDLKNRDEKDTLSNRGFFSGFSTNELKEHIDELKSKIAKKEPKAENKAESDIKEMTNKLKNEGSDWDKEQKDMIPYKFTNKKDLQEKMKDHSVVREPFTGEIVGLKPKKESQPKAENKTKENQKEGSKEKMLHHVDQSILHGNRKFGANDFKTSEHHGQLSWQHRDSAESEAKKLGIPMDKFNQIVGERMGEIGFNRAEPMSPKKEYQSKEEPKAENKTKENQDFFNSLPDKELSKRLDIAREQMQMAVNKHIKAGNIQDLMTGKIKDPVIDRLKDTEDMIISARNNKTIKKSELSEGIKIESEHKDTIKKIIADVKAGKDKPFESYFEGIAKDHLKEIKDYYTRLMSMEKIAMKKSEEWVMKSILIETIKNLGAESLKKSIPTLSESQLELLQETLNEMKKSEEVPQAKVIEGKLSDLKVQNEIADDDVDEKLVKDKNKDIKPQGDNSPEGIEGQVIKSEKESPKEKAEEKSEEKSEVKAEAKKEKEPIKVEMAEEKAEEKAEEPVKKSIQFDDPNKLLKACTYGRNHHFSVNDYYDEILKKAEVKAEENLVKSEKDYDINDIIAKSMDRSAAEIQKVTDLNKSESEKNGKLQKSFEDEDLARAMGISLEEMKTILGE